MCKFCQEPLYIDPNWGYYAIDNELELAIGGWTSVKRVIEPDGRIAIVGSGDGRTDSYYPKYCPECGRQLTKNSAIDEPTKKP